MDSIKISAILPTYNSRQYLAKSIQSLIDQTEPFDEIIIIDDGSTDDSINIINTFVSQHKNIYLLKHTSNQGVCEALNNGLKYATGDYVILCAADDCYFRDIVEHAKSCAQKYPTIGIICGDANVYHNKKKSPNYRMLPFSENTLITSNLFKKIAYRYHVYFNGSGGMFMKRDAILQAGLLHHELRWHSDWLLYITIALQHGIYYIKTPFVDIYMREQSYSSNRLNYAKQKQVMLNTYYAIKNRYPDLWLCFKRAALAPHYTPRYIGLFLSDPTLRKFITLKLLWKLLINNSMITRIGKLFPYRTSLTVRRLIRA